MKTSKTILLVALTLIAGIMIYTLVFNRAKTPPTLPPTVETDRTKQYKDLMTEKCYNEEGVETVCKG